MIIEDIKEIRIDLSNIGWYGPQIFAEIMTDDHLYFGSVNTAEEVSLFLDKDASMNPKNYKEEKDIVFAQKIENEGLFLSVNADTKLTFVLRGETEKVISHSIDKLTGPRSPFLHNKMGFENENTDIVTAAQQITLSVLNRYQTEKNHAMHAEQTYFAPAPVYGFTAGDQVVCGNLSNVRIVAPFQENKEYMISYFDKQKNATCYTTQTWYSLRPLNDEKKILYHAVGEPVRYTQRELGDILHSCYHFGIDLNPEYQRDYVWTDEDKDALLDSVFAGIDIGKFVFVHLPWKDQYSPSYEILDGKQRLMTLMAFYENAYAYHGKFFNDLSFVDQQKFRYTNIDYAELRDVDKRQKLETFIKLNTCGKQVDTRQIEKVQDMLDNEKEKEEEEYGF